MVLKLVCTLAPGKWSNNPRPRERSHIKEAFQQTPDPEPKFWHYLYKPCWTRFPTQQRTYGCAPDNVVSLAQRLSGTRAEGR